MKLKPSQINMTNIKISGAVVERKCDQGDLNQLWRYGGSATTPSDDELVNKLMEIVDWIEGELK